MLDETEIELMDDSLFLLNFFQELYGGHPGLQDHVVFLKPMVWTERGYAISPDLFTMYPELETFFRSKIGMAFYQNYMKYIGVFYLSLIHFYLKIKVSEQISKYAKQDSGSCECIRQSIFPMDGFNG